MRPRTGWSAEAASSWVARITPSSCVWLLAMNEHRLLQRSEVMCRAPGGIDVQIGGLRVRNDDVPKLQQLAPHDVLERESSPTSMT